ncbi:hypothetical protein EDD11_002938 [Mortierella claussenii]|nr:hypothetical protein EDD11_002938 [Mortierella claussenii]
MARRLILHALFHSVASLGYIPFALTSVLISSSTPFVSIPAIGIILIAFVPPLTSFPILCFSYRYLERFSCISLTAQRARTYIILAGSGLCFLLATHLMMVHILANGHNTTYHQMVHTSATGVPVGTNSIHAPMMIDNQDLDEKTTSNVQTGGGEGSRVQTKLTETHLDDYMQTMPFAVPDSLSWALEKIESWPLPSFLSPWVVSKLPVQDGEEQLPQQKQQRVQVQEQQGPCSDSAVSVKTLHQTQKRDVPAERPPLFKSLLPSHLMNPPKGAAAFDIAQPEEVPQEHWQQQQEQQLRVKRDIPSQRQLQQKPEPFLVTEQPLPADELGDGTPFFDIPVSASISAPRVDASTPSSTIPIIADEHSNDHHFGQAQQPFLTTITVASEPPLHLNNNINMNTTKSSRANALFYHSGFNDSIGYNLIGLHWMIYIVSQLFLVFLLFMLFLGVLILTEYILEQEDENFVNLKYLYLARVVGIASATIMSAVHGSILSGYVLLDGQTDWIAKATVATTFVYWSSMVWIMNRVTGPLPY